MGVYKWRDGFQFTASAEAVAQELESLEDKTPVSVLQYAQNKNTELHKCFTWDDSEAARKFRIDEARRVIRGVVIVEESPEKADEVMEYRAFEYVKIAREGEDSPNKQYMAISDALSVEEFRQQIFGEISRSISELSRKAKTYRYLAEKELDTTQKHLELAKEALRG